MSLSFHLFEIFLSNRKGDGRILLIFAKVLEVSAPSKLENGFATKAGARFLNFGGRF